MSLPPLRFQSLWEHLVHFGVRNWAPLSEGNAVCLVDAREMLEVARALQ